MKVEKVDFETDALIPGLNNAKKEELKRKLLGD